MPVTMGTGIQLAALMTCVCAVTQNVPKTLEDTISFHEQMCDLFALNPWFKVDFIAGRKWRIYYSWNIQMVDRCLDMTFENVTEASVNRFWSDMHEYLEMQPEWEAATFLMTMGSSNHQMMLFADQGAAGRMLGVPNIRRDSNVLIPKKSVPLLKFQLKLLNINFHFFLVMMDCNIGATTMSYPADLMPPFKMFNYAASYAVPYTNGNQACIKEQHRHENQFRRDYGLF